jgi:carboxymethylenebutenolidase
MSHVGRSLSRLSLAIAALALVVVTGCARKDSATDNRQPATGDSAANPETSGAPDTLAPAVPSGTMTSVRTERGDIQAYLARPEGTGPFPGVLLIHEWWGLNEQIKTTADRVARMGYVVIVPDLYHGQVASDAEKAHELHRGLTDESALVDLRAALAHMKSMEAVGGSPVGAMGFCMGGHLALVTALSEPIQATVVFYGPPVTDRAQLDKLSGPLLGLFGAEDDGIPAETVKTFEENLKAAGKNVEIKIYDGAGHAFMNNERPSYRPEQASDAWSRVEAFFASHLKS